MKTACLCIFSFLLLFNKPVLSSKNIHSLSLTTVLDAAALSSKSLYIKEKQIQISQQNFKIAYSYFLPKIKVAFRSIYQDYFVEGRDPLASIRLVNESVDVFPSAPLQYNSSLNLFLRQNLFAGFRYQAQYQINSLAMKQAVFARDQEIFKIYADVTQQYWLSCLAQQNLKQARAQVYLGKQKLGVLEAQNASSLITVKKIRAQQLHLNRLTERVSEKARLYQQHLTLLSRLTGLAFSKPSFQSKMRALNDLENVFMGLKNASLNFKSLDQKIIDLKLAIKQQTIRYQKSWLYPVIHLEAGINYFDSSSRFANAFDDLKQGDTYVLLALEYPLFEGFKHRSMLKKARLEKEVSDFHQVLSIQNESNELLDKMNKIENAFTIAKQAKRNSEEMATLYQEMKTFKQLGKLSNLEVLEEEEKLLLSEFAFKQSLIELEILLADLAFLLGEKQLYLKGYQV